jgi:PAS domain S-box-containing protein
LLASGDFVGNLETSLRILGETLALDFIFVSVTQAKAAERREEPPHLHTVLVLENERGRWSELLSSNAGAEPFQYKEAIAADLQEEAFFCGKISDFLNANNLNWEVEENDKLMFIPLRAGHHLKGVLAVGKKQGEALNINFRSLKTYTATLANWLERYEVFRQVRGERDHLRDVLNMGISSDYDKDVLKPEWEHSIMDAQLLNRKIVTTIPDQVFIIDLQDHSNLYSNKPTFLGYRLDDIDDPFEFFQQLIHPDDVGPAFENFFEKLSQSADDEIIESEYRMYSKEGELTWFNERVKVFKRDKQGNVWQYLNILQDITKRK